MNTGHTIAIRWIVAAAWSVASVLGLPVVQGQDELGDGHALDANLQQGSGGINPRSQTPNFSARNDVITGNVPGLGYFHDDVGYGASGEFGGRLGSDDLFRFRARSLSSSPSAIPGDGYTLGVASGQVSVYRSPWAGGAKNVAVPGRDGTEAYHPSGLVVRSPGSAGVVVESSAGRQATLGWDIEAYQQRIGVVSQPEGQLLEIKASPLLGVRRHEVDKASDPSGIQADGDGDEQASVEAPFGFQVNLSPVSAPTVELGRQIQQMRIGQPLADQSKLGDQLAAQVEAGMFRPLSDDTPERGESVYLDLLTRIKQQQRLAHDTPGGQSQPKEEVTQHNRIDGPAWLKGPSDDQLAGAEAAWQRARGGVEQFPLSKRGQDNAGQPHQMQKQPGPLQNLLDKLDYDLPPVATLAGTKGSTIDRLVQQAQDEVRAGQFLDAEEHYRHVLRLRPGDPLGRVGLIHAQIGAGMFRSAVVNLRWLFEHHPELIATRYDTSLLPGAERLKQVSGDLLKTIKIDNQADPALLLAYLGYQNSSSRLVKFALDLAGAHGPDDPLLAMLRTIWLDEENKMTPADALRTNRPARRNGTKSKHARHRTFIGCA